MSQLSSFKVGETYTNDQIRFSLDVENLGGIRPALDASKNVRHVAILTASDDSGKLKTDNPYHDRIEGDVLTYTAQGREGDQELKGRNRRLVEQYAVPTPFFGFTNLGRQSTQNRGAVAPGPVVALTPRAGDFVENFAGKRQTFLSADRSTRALPRLGSEWSGISPA